MQRQWGYKRAAAAIRDLDEPIESFLQPDGTLRRIPHIGPASSRVILEVLQTGRSATVDEAVAASPRHADVLRRRALRGGFLTRADVLAALRDARLHGPTVEAYRGDLQMHSVWSDGSQTLEDIVQTGIARGYAYAAVTDHSYGLPIAGGLSMERVQAQHREIDALNRAHASSPAHTPFRLLKGIEANIRVDGTLDMTDAERRTLDLVVAAPHAALRTPNDQTDRLLAAVRAPAVHILGHPRGRMYSSRPGVTADWDTVFGVAADAGVAIELDGDPARQDLDYLLAQRAVRAGCLFALDSDAHSTREWSYIETAVAHARLAGVPPDRVINTWPLDRLLTWADARRA